MSKRMSTKNAKLHEIWRNAVLKRDDGCCQICPRDRTFKPVKRLNAHHLIPKEFTEWRWDVDNGMTLCVYHHKFGKFSAHKNPVWFVWWLTNNKIELYEVLWRRMKTLI